MAAAKVASITTTATHAASRSPGHEARLRRTPEVEVGDEDKEGGAAVITPENMSTH